MEQCKEIYVCVENLENINLKKLKDDIFIFSHRIYEQMYPDIEIPKKSISVGEIYESKNFLSCQVRFIKNGTIMKCNYIKEDGTFDFEIYEMTHCRHCARVSYTEEEAEKDVYHYFLYNEDYIDEVKKENLEYLNKQKEKELKKQEKIKRQIIIPTKRKKMQKIKEV